MKPSTLLPVFLGVALAGSCAPGYSYCGWALTSTEGGFSEKDLRVACDDEKACAGNHVYENVYFCGWNREVHLYKSCAGNCEGPSAHCV